MTALVWTPFGLTATAQVGEKSVAREWNEVTLDAIRGDFARPTVHARNLFHISAALYDSWAAYDDTAIPYFLGQPRADPACAFDGAPTPTDKSMARSEAMSYAAYRLLKHRFRNSPGATVSIARFDSLMGTLGYPIDFESTAYSAGAPAALGNHVAQCIIAFGLSDGSNEINDYANRYYVRANPPLVPVEPGNPDIRDPNRWQPVALDLFIDQAGFPVAGPPPPFLGPEWGNVRPFAMKPDQATSYVRDGEQYLVYHDPGPPPLLQPNDPVASADYRFGFALVAAWSSHLDPTDDIEWDISPGASGNITQFPESVADYPSFFNLLDGGDAGKGHPSNPATNRPYQPQIVPRGDFARVVAEYWADGPDSETPPGHWFTILNTVMEHADFQRRYRGTGPVVDQLQWDVKAYLALGGALHDAAIAAWSIKGWYDYVRPVSAIRFMADQGQSTDSTLSSFSPWGLPLVPERIEIVESTDPLAGDGGRNIGKLKLRAWRGPNYIDNATTDVAGVGWILAEDWWPYQRPTFVTPPFAGYVSGHSTFSRAGAEVLTLITGDAFFPGGIGEYLAPKDEFLVFEDGPSVDVTLQWATYRDAANQSSLSRIWGGIHPPADDIPGRAIGVDVGVDAFYFADGLFAGDGGGGYAQRLGGVEVFPNPATAAGSVSIRWAHAGQEVSIRVVDVLGRTVASVRETRRSFVRVPIASLAAGHYFVRVTGGEIEASGSFTVVR